MVKLIITQIDGTQFWVLVAGNPFPIFTAKSYNGCLEYTSDYYSIVRSWCCSVCGCKYTPVIRHSKAVEFANGLLSTYKVEHEDGLIKLVQEDGRSNAVIIQDQPFNTAESMFDLLTR